MNPELVVSVFGSIEDVGLFVLVALSLEGLLGETATTKLELPGAEGSLESHGDFLFGVVRFDDAGEEIGAAHETGVIAPDEEEDVWTSRYGGAEGDLTDGDETAVEV